jgi:hypothetical protein
MNGWIVVQCWGDGHALTLGTFASQAEAEAFARREAAVWPSEGWKRAPWAARAEFRVAEDRGGEPTAA